MSPDYAYPTTPPSRGQLTDIWRSDRVGPPADDPRSAQTDPGPFVQWQSVESATALPNRPQTAQKDRVLLCSLRPSLEDAMLIEHAAQRGAGDQGRTHRALPPRLLYHQTRNVR